MNKTISLIILLLLLAPITSAQSICQSDCALQKNNHLETLNSVKRNLANCQPEFLSCVQKEKLSYVLCKKNLVECDIRGKIAIKESAIESNIKYRECLSSCPAEAPAVVFTKVEISPFCSALNEAMPVLIAKFTPEQIQKFRQMNNCPSWALI